MSATNKKTKKVNKKVKGSDVPRFPATVLTPVAQFLEARLHVLKKEEKGNKKGGSLYRHRADDR